jgi:hypothetical protein
MEENVFLDPAGIGLFGFADIMLHLHHVLDPGVFGGRFSKVLYSGQIAREVGGVYNHFSKMLHRTFLAGFDYIESFCKINLLALHTDVLCIHIVGRKNMKTEPITAIQFLDGLFVRDMQHALECGLHYYAFPLLCQGIELMGFFFDRYPIDERGKSKSRFFMALDILFTDQRYRHNKKLLYEGLRGNMIHQKRPGAACGLTSSKNEQADRSLHFQQMPHGPVVLVLEVLLEDFRNALATLIGFIEKGDPRLDDMKVKGPFFTYGPVSG